MKFKNIFHGIFYLFVIFLSTKTNASSDMNFYIYTPCDGNGSMCSPYIFANGIISSETPNKFRKFLEENKNDLYSPTIYFNSDGGSLISGLELAKIIRNKKLNTYIGVVEDVDFNFSEKEPSKRYKTILKKSECYSACAYAFLGGVTREIDWDNANYGIHQFYSGDSIKEGDAQIISSSLAIFLDSMGVNRRLLDLASFTRKDDIYLLDAKIAKELRIENSGEEKLDWKLQADKNGNLSICSTVKQEDNESFTTLCFINIKDKIIANLIYSPSSKYPIKDVIEAFSNEDDNEEKDQRFPQLSIVFGNKEIPIKNKTRWKSIDDNLGKSFPVTNNMLVNLTDGSEFSIEASFPNVYGHINPSATFSNNGLSGGIKALIK